MEKVEAERDRNGKWEVKEGKVGFVQWQQRERKRKSQKKIYWFWFLYVSIHMSWNHGFGSGFPVCGALTLSRVIVPSYKLAGETVTLECPYELNRNQRDRLYSVKWYKDDEEFYRYIPRSIPTVKFFDKLDGVRVQVSIRTVPYIIIS